MVGRNAIRSYGSIFRKQSDGRMIPPNVAYMNDRLQEFLMLMMGVIVMSIITTTAALFLVRFKNFHCTDHLNSNKLLSQDKHSIDCPFVHCD